MYGSNTPHTDSDDDNQSNHVTPGNEAGAGGGYTDEDDDINHNTNNGYSDYGSGGGGFTETVLDDDNNDGVGEDNGAWDDDQGMNNGGGENNNNHEEYENWVDVDYEGQSFHVPLTDKIRTFGDIKQYMLEKNAEQQHSMGLGGSMVSIQITSTHYIMDEETDHEYQDDDDALIANHKQLVVKWHCFQIKIVDGLDFCEEVTVAEDFTIQKIKEKVEQDRNVRLDQLTKDGIELLNGQTLRELNIFADGHTLISRICITIIDDQCDLSTDILVCEFWSIKEVLDTYLSSSRREKHERATLSLDENILDLQSSVYHEKIENGTKLKYFVGKYTVLVYDSDIQQSQLYASSMNGGDQPCQEIEVLDNQTIDEIRTEYARITHKPFMDNDKFLSNERHLPRNVPLFKLRIKDNEPLIIEREQQQKAAEYICAECGSIVKLSPFDAVQCRDCFMNVVYKKRTARVCQYNCR